MMVAEMQNVRKGFLLSGHFRLYDLAFAFFVSDSDIILRGNHHLNTTFIITELSPEHFFIVFAGLSEIMRSTAFQLELEMLFLRNIIRGCFGFDSIDFGW